MPEDCALLFRPVVRNAFVSQQCNRSWKRTAPGGEGEYLMIIALDTSVVIAGLLSWHEHHSEALSAIQRSLTETVVLPAPTLVESYAVMTRLPAPHRLGPGDAYATLEGSFRKETLVVGLTKDEPWDLLKDLSGDLFSGGITYDAQILACARKAGADSLLTLNRRHFERLANENIDVVVPQSI